MISQTKTSKGTVAITSDQWHVVRARWNSGAPSERPFDRSVVSEHTDRTGAVEAARNLARELNGRDHSRPVFEQDQLFVRRPGFKTLKFARRRERHP